ncbi:ABCF4, partial [Symbiodinium sp. CCMP2456]
VAKAAVEAERQAAVDAMMNPECSEEEESEEEPAPKANASDFRPPPRAAAQRAEEKEAEQRMREEAAQRRQEKLAERAAERAEKTSGKKDMAALLEKVAQQGEGKLSNKERRLYAKHLEKQKEEAEEEEAAAAKATMGAEAARLEEELRAFAVSLPSGLEPTKGAVDLHLEGFSISAGGQRLFDDAALKLAKGRRYGLLGPNGAGKTTLLKHLATRKLPLPERWTVTLVQQEAEATELHVVDEVLSADTTRRNLLASEARLLEKLESFGEGEEAEELQKLCDELSAVCDDLEAMGADAAEARVRKILCGLGFTSEMIDGPVNILSGGWRMRVSLAKALFLEPDLLLLDEPTNHLDLDAVLWLDEYLCEYPKTLLVVSHDADFLDSVCTDVLHLEERKLIPYRGGYTEFKKGHAARVRDREKEFKKQQEDKKAGKKQHPDEARFVTHWKRVP